MNLPDSMWNCEMKLVNTKDSPIFLQERLRPKQSKCTVQLMKVLRYKLILIEIRTQESLYWKSVGDINFAPSRGSVWTEQTAQLLI